jgi:nitrite reductase (NO-forming)
MMELIVDYPGRYLLVDHAISRLERGLVGFLYVEGEADPTIFDAEGVANDAGH